MFLKLSLNFKKKPRASNSLSLFYNFLALHTELRRNFFTRRRSALPFVSYEFQHKKPPEKIAFFSLRISSEILTWKSGAPSLTRNIDIIDYSSILDFWPRLFIYTQELFDKEWYLPKSSSDLPILHLYVPTDKT